MYGIDRKLSNAGRNEKGCIIISDENGKGKLKAQIDFEIKRELAEEPDNTLYLCNIHITLQTRGNRQFMIIGNNSEGDIFKGDLQKYGEFMGSVNWKGISKEYPMLYEKLGKYI